MVEAARPIGIAPLQPQGRGMVRIGSTHGCRLVEARILVQWSIAIVRERSLVQVKERSFEKMECVEPRHRAYHLDDTGPPLVEDTVECRLTFEPPVHLRGVTVERRRNGDHL